MRQLLDATALRGIRFVLVGGSTFVLNVGAFWLLVEADVAATIALTLSYSLSLVAHFLGSRFFTFRERSVSRGVLPRYLLATALSLAVASALSFMFRALGTSPSFSGALAITVTTVLSYFLLNLFVFSSARDAATFPSGTNTPRSSSLFPAKKRR